MKPQTIFACLWFVLAGIGSGAACARPKAQADLEAKLRVSVFNDAQVSHRKLLAGERAASSVFAHAGVSVQWLNCGLSSEGPEEQAACSEGRFPAHLHLRIVPHSLNLSASTFGISFQEEDGAGCHADIFYEGVQRVRQSGYADSAIILGMVMAHELGHLLLGVNSHSLVGLMRPHWNPDDLSSASQGKLGFTLEQGQTLRARLADDFQARAQHPIQ